MDSIIVAFRKRGDPKWEEITKRVAEMAFDGVCKSGNGGVNPYYVRDEVKYADMILVADGGFLLADFREDVYIKVVCANKPGVGKALILKTMEIGRHRGFQGVSLHALPSVLTYYPRFGFKLPGRRKIGSNIVGYLMKKNLSNTVNWRERRQSPRLQEKRKRTSNIRTPPQVAQKPRIQLSERGLHEILMLLQTLQPNNAFTTKLTIEDLTRLVPASVLDRMIRVMDEENSYPSEAAWEFEYKNAFDNIERLVYASQPTS